jgi:DNA replicative helicase MCM subunit Mcm2 (Cdc46/Mcm family)
MHNPGSKKWQQLLSDRLKMAYIREIARSLYQLKNRLEELEQAWESEPPGEKRDQIEHELKKIRLEYEKVKNILEGAKESPSP